MSEDFISKNHVQCSIIKDICRNIKIRCRVYVAEKFMQLIFNEKSIVSKPIIILLSAYDCIVIYVS